MQIPGYLVRNALITAAFNTAIATLITMFQGTDWGISLLYSQCIGISIWALVEVGRRLFIHDPDRHWTRLMGIVPLAGVSGFFAGVAMADLLLDKPALSYWSESPVKAMAYLLMSLTAGLAITYLFVSREHMAQARLREQTALAQASEARLRLLQSQLEPHMLFNTLANLRALVTTDQTRALVMLDHLNRYLRATLSDSRKPSQDHDHTVQQEFDRLHDYLQLMAVRMGPRLRFEFVVPSELAGLSLPPLLLQPLVENAIRHGLEPNVARGTIRIEASSPVGGQLRLSVCDDGCGLAGEPARGFGLTQVHERLQAAFGQRAWLQWDSTPGQGTRVHLTLPLQRPATPSPIPSSA